MAQVELLRRRLAKLPNYVRRFGLWHGVRLVYSIERNFPAKAGPICRLTLPGPVGPVFLRRSTADHAIFWQCIVQNQYDISAFPHARRLKAVYEATVQRGERPLIIDCGANIGLATLSFAQQFPEARICAVEPDLQNFNMVLRNVESLGARVQVLHGAVWSESGHVRIKNPTSGSAAFQVEMCSPDDAQAVKAYSISEICKIMGADAPFIVKADIEGSQKDLFSRNTAWVGQVHLIALELDDWLMPWQGTSRPFFSSLSKYPFEYLIRGETIFCFQDLGEVTS